MNQALLALFMVARAKLNCGAAVTFAGRRSACDACVLGIADETPPPNFMRYSRSAPALVGKFFDVGPLAVSAEAS
jgi:hypothetical protein